MNLLRHTAYSNLHNRQWILQLLLLPTTSSTKPNNLSGVERKLTIASHRVKLFASAHLPPSSRIALISSRCGMEPCTSSDYLDHSDPISESFSFPPPSPVWVGRFFIKSIVWFSSPISRLDWEVFHQINQGFSLNQPSQVSQYCYQPHLISL